MAELTFPVYEYSQLFENDPALLKSLQEDGFLIINMSPEIAATIEAGVSATQAFFDSPLEKKNAYKLTAKVGYKRHQQKERYQARRYGLTNDYGMASDAFKQAVHGVYDVFEGMTWAVLEQVCQHCSIDYMALKQEYGDPNPLGEAEYATSVFNAYHYFNGEETKVENCVEHIDPGFLTVLGCSPVSGLEVSWFKTPDVYYAIEPLLTTNNLIIIPGETLQRVTDGKVKGNKHRVTFNNQPRLNLTFELRPKKPIYHPWHSLPH